MLTKFLVRIPREGGELVVSKVVHGSRKFIEFRRVRTGGVDAVVMVQAEELGALIEVLKGARQELMGIPRGKL